TLYLSDATLDTVRGGDVLRLGLGGGDSRLALVVDRRAGTLPATVEVSAASLLRLPSLPVPGGTLKQVELLRFDLMIATGYERPTTLAGVGFNAGHPRFWGEV